MQIKMVVQKSWNNIEASHQNTASENTSSSTWNFQAPAKAVVNIRGTVSTNVPVVSSPVITIFYIRHINLKPIYHLLYLHEYFLDF